MDQSLDKIPAVWTYINYDFLYLDGLSWTFLNRLEKSHLGYVITSPFCCGNNDEAAVINRLSCWSQLLNKCDTSSSDPHTCSIRLWRYSASALANMDCNEYEWPIDWELFTCIPVFTKR